ncbi:MAG: sulfur carrier protein ThiS [Verrucomicrobiaceae bacterium]|nr:sulfur carrier protein ThiS [Verrucomicrobiaceae bacterium]
MTITLNGTKKEITGAATIGDLLHQIGFGGKPVVVEQNQRALFPREIPAAPLNEGDVVEIVQVTAGG